MEVQKQVLTEKNCWVWRPLNGVLSMASIGFRRIGLGVTCVMCVAESHWILIRLL